MIIGITGKSGSGKSTTSKYISGLGYFVIDVDIIHKKLAKEYDTEIDIIFNDYGLAVLSKEDKIKEFFKNKELRNSIDNLIFEKTKESIINIISKNKKNIIFIDAPLLFEMKLDKICDEIWYVSCIPIENIKRLMNRNGVTPEDAWNRYNAINFEDKKFTWEIDTSYGIPEDNIKKQILLLKNTL